MRRNRVGLRSSWGLTLLLTIAGRHSSPSAVVDSHLTQTDLEVLRVTLQADIQPRIRKSTDKQRIVLKTGTLAIPLWVEPPPRKPLPPSPPSSPPPFGVATIAKPSPPPPLALEAAALTASENTAWRLRNRLSLEIPEIGIPDVVRMRIPDAAIGTVVKVSAPAYPTTDSAVICAQFICGETCGEGRLLRLRREHQRGSSRSRSDCGLAESCRRRRRPSSRRGESRVGVLLNVLQGLQYAGSIVSIQNSVIQTAHECANRSS